MMMILIKKKKKRRESKNRKERRKERKKWKKGVRYFREKDMYKWFTYSFFFGSSFLIVTTVVRTPGPPLIGIGKVET